MQGIDHTIRWFGDLMDAIKLINQQLAQKLV